MPAVSWNPDGKSLVVVQNGEKQLPGLAMMAIDRRKAAAHHESGRGQRGRFHARGELRREQRGVRAAHAERRRRISFCAIRRAEECGG